MKPKHIKLWPDLTYSTTATFYFRPLRSKDQEVILDFRNCKYVNSSGLTILLIRILKMIREDSSLSWSIELPANNQVSQRMENLRFFEILDSYIENKDLFWSIRSRDDISIIQFEGRNFENIVSVPICPITLEAEQDRGFILAKFKTWLSELLEKHLESFDFAINQFALVLNEIVKNGIDHSQKKTSFVGIDFIANESKNKLKVCFSIGDLGNGLLQNVRKYLHKEGISRAEYLGNDEMYKWALEFGNTTAFSSPFNAGIGMPTIIDGSKPINLDLYVFDGYSCGYLSNIESLSYSDIRRNFYDFGHSIGFYYFGEINIDISK